MCHYQATLGLEFNLQSLQCPLELTNFSAGGLKDLRAAGDLLVQLVKLHDGMQTYSSCRKIICVDVHCIVGLNVLSCSSDLGLVPVVHITAVLLSDGLVLSSDLVNGSGHVLLGSGIHFDIHSAGIHLVSQCCHFLWEEISV